MTFTVTFLLVIGTFGWLLFFFAVFMLDTTPAHHDHPPVVMITDVDADDYERIAIALEPVGKAPALMQDMTDGPCVETSLQELPTLLVVLGWKECDLQLRQKQWKLHKHNTAILRRNDCRLYTSEVPNSTT